MHTQTHFLTCCGNEQFQPSEKLLDRVALLHEDSRNDVLNLSDIIVDDALIRVLCRFLPNILLKTLSLSNCRINDHRLKQLLSGILAIGSLKVLDLSRNLLTSNSTQDLIRLIQSIETLQELNLGDNSIGTGQIFSALHNNSSLISLNMKNTNLHPDSFSVLADCLNSNRYLSYIDVSNNECGIESGQAAVNAMKENSSVLYFQIENTQMGLQNELLIAALCEKNQSHVQSMRQILADKQVYEDELSNSRLESDRLRTQVFQMSEQNKLTSEQLTLVSQQLAEVEQLNTNLSSELALLKTDHESLQSQHEKLKGVYAERLEKDNRRVSSLAISGTQTDLTLQDDLDGELARVIENKEQIIATQTEMIRQNNITFDSLNLELDEARDVLGGLRDEMETLTKDLEKGRLEVRMLELAFGEEDSKLTKIKEDIIVKQVLLEQLEERLKKAGDDDLELNGSPVTKQKPNLDSSPDRSNTSFDSSVPEAEEAKEEELREQRRAMERLQMQREDYLAGLSNHGLAFIPSFCTPLSDSSSTHPLSSPVPTKQFPVPASPFYSASAILASLAEGTSPVSLSSPASLIHHMPDDEIQADAEFLVTATLPLHQRQSQLVTPIRTRGMAQTQQFLYRWTRTPLNPLPPQPKLAEKEPEASPITARPNPFRQSSLVAQSFVDSRATDQLKRKEKENATMKAEILELNNQIDSLQKKITDSEKTAEEMKQRAEKMPHSKSGKHRRGSRRGDPTNKDDSENESENAASSREAKKVRQRRKKEKALREKMEGELEEFRKQVGLLEEVAKRAEAKEVSLNTTIAALMSDLRQEKLNVEELTAKLQESHDEMSAGAEQAEDDRRRNEAAVAEKEETIQQLESQIDSLRQNVATIQATLDQAIEQKNELAERLREHSDEMSVGLEQAEDDLRKRDALLAEKDQTISQLETQIDSLQRNVAAVQETLDKVNEQKAGLVDPALVNDQLDEFAEMIETAMGLLNEGRKGSKGLVSKIEGMWPFDVSLDGRKKKRRIRLQRSRPKSSAAGRRHQHHASSSEAQFPSLLTNTFETLSNQLSHLFEESGALIDCFDEIDNELDNWKERQEEQLRNEQERSTILDLRKQLVDEQKRTADLEKQDKDQLRVEEDKWQMERLEHQNTEAQLKDNLAKLEKKRKDLKAALKEERNKLEQSERALHDEKRKREEIEGRLESSKEQMKEGTKEIDQLKDKIFQLELEIQKQVILNSAKPPQFQQTLPPQQPNQISITTQPQPQPVQPQFIQTQPQLVPQFIPVVTQPPQQPLLMSNGNNSDPVLTQMVTNEALDSLRSQLKKSEKETEKRQRKLEKSEMRVAELEREKVRLEEANKELERDLKKAERTQHHPPPPPAPVEPQVKIVPQIIREKADTSLLEEKLSHEREERRKVSGDLQRYRQTLEEEKQKTDTLDRQKRKLERQLADVKANLSTLEETIKRVEKERDEKQKALKEEQSLSKELKRTIAAHEDVIERMKEQERISVSELQRTRDASAAKKKELAERQKEIGALQTTLDKFKADLAEREKALVEAQQTILDAKKHHDSVLSKVQRDMKQLENDKRGAKEKLDKLQKKYDAAVEKTNQLHDAYKRHRDTIQQQHTDINRLKDEKEAEQRRCDMDNEENLRKMREFEDRLREMRDEIAGKERENDLLRQQHALVQSQAQQAQLQAQEILKNAGPVEQSSVLRIHRRRSQQRRDDSKTSDNSITTDTPSNLTDNRSTRKTKSSSKHRHVPREDRSKTDRFTVSNGGANIPTPRKLTTPISVSTASFGNYDTRPVPSLQASIGLPNIPIHTPVSPAVTFDVTPAVAKGGLARSVGSVPSTKKTEGSTISLVDTLNKMRSREEEKEKETAFMQALSAVREDPPNPGTVSGSRQSRSSTRRPDSETVSHRSGETQSTSRPRLHIHIHRSGSQNPTTETPGTRVLSSRHSVRSSSPGTGHLHLDARQPND